QDRNARNERSHAPGGRGGFKPREERSFGRNENRFEGRTEGRGNRESAPREANGNSVGYAARPEFNRIERPTGDRPRSFGRNENRFEGRGNRESVPREANGNSVGYAARPEFNRTERPTGDRPRSFGDRNANGGRDRANTERSGASAPNRSFGDAAAFGKKPFPRDGQNSAPRNDNRVLGARFEGRADTARRDSRTDSRPAGRNSSDSRSFGNANAGGSGAPRRPRSFA
ncbi:MAG TPA: hypothetical protein PKL58_01930, partial [Methylophilaceae bacterium]|nr:hypothetical protein [Methylophilaceae bacterium]